MSRTPAAGSAAERLLDHEIDEVEAAIALVLTGAAASVSLTGISQGEALVELFRVRAAQSGVAIEAIWGWEEDHADLLIRRAAANGDPGDGMKGDVGHDA